MKKLIFLLTLVLTMSSFASGFQISDLEQKEKVELSQDLSFDKVEAVKAISFDASEILVVDVGDSEIKHSLISIFTIQNLQPKNQLISPLYNNQDLDNSLNIFLQTHNNPSFRLDDFVVWKV